MKKTILFVTLAWASLFTAISHADCVAPDDANWASMDGGCKDLATGLVWSRDPYYTTGTAFTFNGAQNFCAGLTENGYSDWRTATRAEISAAVSHGAVTRIDLEGGVTDNRARWTSEQVNRKSAYTNSFRTGTVGTKTKTSFTATICVR